MKRRMICCGLRAPAVMSLLLGTTISLGQGPTFLQERRADTAEGSEGRALRPEERVLELYGHGETRGLFTFRALGEWDDEIPVYTQVAVPQSQDGMVLESVTVRVSPGEACEYRPDTICVEPSTEPRSGYLGTWYGLADESPVCESASSPQFRADLESNGFALAESDPLVVSLMEALTELVNEEQLRSLPLHPLDTTQLVYWGLVLSEDEFTRVFDEGVTSLVKENPAYRAADPDQQEILLEELVEKPKRSIDAAVATIAQDLNLSGVKMHLVPPSRQARETGDVTVPFYRVRADEGPLPMDAATRQESLEAAQGSRWDLETELAQTLVWKLGNLRFDARLLREAVDAGGVDQEDIRSALLSDVLYRYGVDVETATLDDLDRILQEVEKELADTQALVDSKRTALIDALAFLNENEETLEPRFAVSSVALARSAKDLSILLARASTIGLTAAEQFVIQVRLSRVLSALELNREWIRSALERMKAEDERQHRERVAEATDMEMANEALGGVVDGITQALWSLADGVLSIPEFISTVREQGFGTTLEQSVAAVMEKVDRLPEWYDHATHPGTINDPKRFGAVIADVTSVAAEVGFVAQLVVSAPRFIVKFPELCRSVVTRARATAGKLRTLIATGRTAGANLDDLGRLEKTATMLDDLATKTEQAAKAQAEATEALKAARAAESFDDFARHARNGRKAAAQADSLAKETQQILDDVKNLDDAVSSADDVGELRTIELDSPKRSSLMDDIARAEENIKRGAQKIREGPIVDGKGNISTGNRLGDVVHTQKPTYKPSQPRVFRQHIDRWKAEFQRMGGKDLDWSKMGESFTDSSGKLHDPITVDANGTIVQGHHRFVAAHELGITIPKSAIRQLPTVSGRMPRGWGQVTEWKLAPENVTPSSGAAE